MESRHLNGERVVDPTGPSFRPRVGVAVFCWQNHRFLIGKRMRGHGEGTWSLPGGALEGRETFEVGGRREVREECGIDVQHLRILATTNDIGSDFHWVTIWLDAMHTGGTEEVRSSTEFGDPTWVTLPELLESDNYPLFQPFWDNFLLSPAAKGLVRF